MGGNQETQEEFCIADLSINKEQAKPVAGGRKAYKKWDSDNEIYEIVYVDGDEANTGTDP